MVQVDDGVYQHNVEVSGNVGPCECPGNYVGEEVVLTSVPVFPFLAFVAISENVLSIRALLPVFPR